MKKDSIYLEPDDDITSIIEKVKASKSSIVALVPPKKMPVLQSSVNLKLLKKESTSSKKKIVIVTTESTLLPLAGSVGLFVADTLNSKPYVPDSPDKGEGADIELDDASGVNAAAAAAVPVGILAKGQKDKSKDSDKKEDDNEKKDSKNEKLAGILPAMKGRIPNFGKFRTKLILVGGGLVVFGFLWYIAFYVLPEATVLVNAQTTRVQLETEFTFDEDAETDDLEEKILVPTEETLKKSNNVTVEATGEKNVGKKATGLVNIDNCASSDPITIEAGTRITSSSGFTYVADQNTTVPGGTFFLGCISPGEAPVSVTAEDGGSDYNLVSGLSYTVAGFDPDFLDGEGGKMSGGTDDIETVVSQEDIDNALGTLVYNDHSQAQAELEAQFSTTITPLVGTFKVKEGKPKGEPAVGEEAKEVVVTLQYTYTMEGVSMDSLDTLLNEALLAEAGEDTELEIYDNGLSEADMDIDKDKVTLTTDSFVGPKLDAEAIAQEIAGLGFSAARDLLLAKDGVNSVEIDLSPFWVFSLPSADKIDVTIDIAEHALQNNDDQESQDDSGN